ncbi:hypothetical protein ACMT4L_01440 [Deinococcus sp. A31D244]|uniref:hypothetical protein n=1 Tax=Deinococcus sp. A31D244 TaxID=3397675 RepID=UPI0039DF62A5
MPLTALDDHVCASVGALAGAIPPLWTLRVAVKLTGQKYGVELGEFTSTSPKKEGDSA